MNAEIRQQIDRRRKRVVTPEWVVAAAEFLLRPSLPRSADPGYRSA